MKCPFCAHEESSVLESRESEDGEVTRRRRECSKCDKRFTTYERLEGPALTVIKKDGRREPFDRNKVRRGVIRACEKRPITATQIETVVDQVEREMLRKKDNEVESKVIGKAILRRLKNLDKAAYLRFASVYLEFSDINDFAKLITKLK